jgi:hypothetical protein
LLDVNRTLHVSATKGSHHQALHKRIKRVICTTAVCSLPSQTLQFISLMKCNVQGYCSVDNFHTPKHNMTLGSSKFM